MEATSHHLTGEELKRLTQDERHKLALLFKRARIARDLHQEFESNLTFGQRLADKVAEFGGSWTFIGLFAVVLIGWCMFNSFMLAARAFDPYPYILLNLLLSTVAALQAPVIMMSQNRQAAKDRLVQQHDYDVNLKAELEIMALHDKLDELRLKQFSELLEIQERQISMLKDLSTRK
jgi:uncharacterized membrane protein